MTLSTTSLKVPFLLLCFCFISEQLWVNECTTPNHSPGVCKPLKQCPVLYSLLDDVTIEKVTFLRKSLCGFEKNKKEPSVCCPVNVEKESYFEHKECGISAFTERIIGGNVSLLTEYPWNVILKYQEPTNQSEELDCGGALISSRHVLTAAHCIQSPKNLILKTVLIGEHDLTNDTDCVNYEYGVDCGPPPLEVPVQQTFVHPDYNQDDKNQRNDIAVIKLQDNVTFSDFVRPVCLPRVNMRDSGRKWLIQTGWGVRDNKFTSNVKTETLVAVQCKRICEKLFGTKLGKNQFCGKTEHLTVCGTDDGGFATTIKLKSGLRHYIAGVVALTKCNTTVYTKVDEYYDWIVDKMNQ